MSDKRVICPRCHGHGVVDKGRSIQGDRSQSFGNSSTYPCECCQGTGSIPEGTDPDWWKVSDNATGGR